MVSGPPPFFYSIQLRYALSNELRATLEAAFHALKVPSRTTLLQAGEVSRKMYVIEQGAVRVWYNQDGKDITTQFFFERNMVGSIESFRKQAPSPVAIETIEPCRLWWIGKADADRILSLMQDEPSLRDQLLDRLLERTFDYMKHAFSFITLSPEQRYLKLLEERPEVVQRVAQHYIASYLGISSVHLSRIKSRLARKG